MGLLSTAEQLLAVMVFLAVFTIVHFSTKWCWSRNAYLRRRLPEKCICLVNGIIFGFICGLSGFHVWYFPSAQQLADPLRGDNLVQEWACLIGVAYFIYDLFIVFFVDFSLLYIVHGILGFFFTYLGGVVPLASYCGWFVMGYEISTPFKNARYLMLKMGFANSHPIEFKLLEIAFIFSFFLVRVILGIPAMYAITFRFHDEIKRLTAYAPVSGNGVHLMTPDLTAFFGKMQAELRVNGANSQALATAALESQPMAVWKYKLHYYGTWFLLCGGWLMVLMNVYWGVAIVKGLVLFTKRKEKFVIPEDENEILDYEKKHN